jgi:hypothetical protein
MPRWLKLIVEAVVGLLKKKGLIDSNANKKPTVPLKLKVRK